MNNDLQRDYEHIRTGGIGFFEQERGLIEVSGKEAVGFLNGLMTNDAAKLENNAQMSAAFPNAQGRLIAVVRVIRRDDKFLFETESATREILFNNLFRFTYAGDFFVEDLSDNYTYLQISDAELQLPDSGSIKFQSKTGSSVFVQKESAENFFDVLKKNNAVEISNELYEVLRIENGIPFYGVDVDETTIVPEIGLPDLISYQKGCYIGQEIIARIHFRGHVAKQLTGLILSQPVAAANKTAISELINGGIKSQEGKNAGRITSVTFSPKLQKIIALAYIRYDYLAEGTALTVGDFNVQVKNLPFVG